MVGAGNTFFQINQSMTAHLSGPGPDLSRVGVKGSQVIAWPQFRTNLLPAAMAEATLAGRQPEGLTLQGLLEGVPVGWGEQSSDRSRFLPIDHRRPFRSNSSISQERESKFSAEQSKVENPCKF
jgi:hypothetical protein